LVLDDLGRLPRVVGIDDDLRIREIRDRIHRHRAEQAHAGHEHDDRAERHELAALDRPRDELFDHGLFPLPPSPFPISLPPMFRPIPLWSINPRIAAARFDSESSRKGAEATTSSPRFKPSPIPTRESPRGPPPNPPGPDPPTAR